MFVCVQSLDVGRAPHPHTLVMLLPYTWQEARGVVAQAMLRESARALERALLDGGPCRW